MTSTGPRSRMVLKLRQRRRLMTGVPELAEILARLPLRPRS